MPSSRRSTRLRAQGHVFDEDGAVWLRTTDFGDDKDRVLIRANGEPTYFAADAAYYLSKKDRGFDEKIYLLGADHHGYVDRLKAIAACAGDDPEHNIEVLIGQLVNLNGAKLSKRAGNIIELRRPDQLDRHRRAPLLAGALPGRLPAVARRRGAAQADQRQPGLLRAVRPRPHIQRREAARGRTASTAADGFDPSLLTDPTESALLGASSATSRGSWPTPPHLREPHRVARYLEDLAGHYHKWYDTCRVRPMTADEESPTCTAPGCGSTTPPARCWPTAWTSLGRVSRPRAGM